MSFLAVGVTDRGQKDGRPMVGTEYACIVSVGVNGYSTAM